MLSRIPLGSRSALRTDKKRRPLARKSRRRPPDVGPPASLLCDVLPQPTGEAAENGYLTKLSSVCHLCIGNCVFARDYGCVHPGMPLNRKQFRRSRDAPIWEKAAAPERHNPFLRARRDSFKEPVD